MEKKEAMKILKEFHDKSALFSVRTALDTIIPELKESEDERIRKKLIKALKECGFTHFNDEFTVEEAISWLEKQDNTDIEQVFRPLAGCCIDTAAEQAVELQKQGKNVVLAFNGCYIPVKNNTTDAIVNEYYSWIEKQGKQKPTDKSEPKFKVGDWITNNCAVWCIDSIHNGLYNLKGQNGGVISNSNPKAIDNNFHLWTIQDAKDGDVLALDWKDACHWQKIVIFKSLNEFGVEGYGTTFKNNKLAFMQNFPYYSKTWSRYLYPATKEQRDLLFQKMKEVGYEWDSVKKKLKKIKWVDLGLPSGTLWKSKKEEGFHTYDEAVKNFGHKLPTKEQLEELKEKCNWKWTGKGYKVTGPNGNSIFLYAAGYRYRNSDTFLDGTHGYYWISTQNDSKDAWYFHLNSSKVNIYKDIRYSWLSIFLVKNK